MTRCSRNREYQLLAAQGGDFWRTIASGNFTVDAQTKAEAQEAIPQKNGFWGVSQTSQREFLILAAAVAGDDVEK